MSLLNKVALVTGASSGIGAAIAVKFASEGAKVAIIGRNETKLKTVAEQCSKNGSKPLAIIADIAKDDDAKKTVSDTIKEFGKLDVLVNNAGIGMLRSIIAPDALQVYDEVMAINVRAVVNITNLAALHLIQNKGNMINISSSAALAPFVNTGFAYNTSKAALDHFTRTVALELAPKGVRANTVNPGPVYTDILKNTGQNDEQVAKSYEMMKKSTALNRVSDAEEIADLVLFLASEKARSITGATFVIDNGTILRN